MEAMKHEIEAVETGRNVVNADDTVLDENGNTGAAEKTQKRWLQQRTKLASVVLLVIGSVLYLVSDFKWANESHNSTTSLHVVEDDLARVNYRLEEDRFGRSLSERGEAGRSVGTGRAKSGEPRLERVYRASAAVESSERELQTPEELYYDESWTDLPQEIQDAYAVLGYNDELWDGGLSSLVGDLGWIELTAEHQEAALFIGYTEEIWCDTLAPTVGGGAVSQPVQIQQVTDSPTKQPTTKPVTDSPTKQPTEPVTDIPTKQPSREPVTNSPTNTPTTKPVTVTQTKQPTEPVTDIPTKQPSREPITNSPTNAPFPTTSGSSSSSKPTGELSHNTPDVSEQNKNPSGDVTSSPTRTPTGNAPTTPSPTQKPNSHVTSRSAFSKSKSHKSSKSYSKSTAKYDAKATAKSSKSSKLSKSDSKSSKFYGRDD